jgi:hypothetical protein
LRPDAVLLRGQAEKVARPHVVGIECDRPLEAVLASAVTTPLAAKTSASRRQFSDALGWRPASNAQGLSVEELKRAPDKMRAKHKPKYERL